MTALTSHSRAIERRAGLELLTDSEGRTIVITPDSGRQVRLAEGAAQLFALLDGTRDAAALGTDLGAAPEVVAQALTRLAALGLLEPLDGTAAAAPEPAPRRLVAATRSLRRPARFGRWRYRPPLVLEFTFMDPRGLLARLRPLIRVLSSRPAQALIWLVTAIGLVALLTSGPTLATDLARPLPWTGFAVAFASLIGLTFIHELTHAASLTNRGGRVRRIGFMLLYGSPALFCDVSESWRLARRGRVSVALAGIRVHGLAAAIAGIGVATLAPGPLRETLALIAAGNLLMCAVNLCPFVKFDGYIALIGYLDAPHLRRRCMDEAMGVFGRVVFGSRAPLRTSAGRVAFGAACALAAPVLVAYTLLTYGPLLLQALGPVGALIVLAIVGAAIALPATRVANLARAALRTGAPRARVIAGGLLACVLVSAALATVPVRFVMSTVYDHGVVVAPDGLTIPAGAPVTLRRAGIVLHKAVAQGRICGPVRPGTVSAAAGSPILIHSTRTVSATVAPVCGASGAPESGIATIDGGTIPAGTWLRHVFIDPALGRLPSL